ncbi:hypothetical protein JHK87_050586 [Glycine soja]|nr:hypothetical protein JHK87_050586 [Glycine soja]
MAVKLALLEEVSEESMNNLMSLFITSVYYHFCTFTLSRVIGLLLPLPFIVRVLPLNISLRVLEFEDEAYNLKVISLISSCAVSEIVAVPPRRSQPHNLKGGSCVAHTPACPAPPVKVKRLLMCTLMPWAFAAQNLAMLVPLFENMDKYFKDTFYHYWKKAILRRSNRGYNDVFRTSLNVTSSKLKNFNDGSQNNVFESEQLSKMVLTSATSLKIPHSLLHSRDSNPNPSISSAIELIAKKLHNLGITEPLTSSSEIHVLFPHDLPKQHVGHTFEPS